MTRELKFRAWNRNIEPGEMLEPKTLQQFAAATLTEVNEKWPNIDLMQFTGKKDKNGKEIYEGDFIKENFENNFGSFQEGIGLIMWCENCSAFHARINGDGEGFVIGSDCEVIGNVHQNPEFIKHE